MIRTPSTGDSTPAVGSSASLSRSESLPASTFNVHRSFQHKPPSLTRSPPLHTPSPASATQTQPFYAQPMTTWSNSMWAHSNGPAPMQPWPAQAFAYQQQQIASNNFPPQPMPTQLNPSQAAPPAQLRQPQPMNAQCAQFIPAAKRQSLSLTPSQSAASSEMVAANSATPSSGSSRSPSSLSEFPPLPSAATAAEKSERRMSLAEAAQASWAKRAGVPDASGVAKAASNNVNNKHSPSFSPSIEAKVLEVEAQLREVFSQRDEALGRVAALEEQVAKNKIIHDTQVKEITKLKEQVAKATSTSAPTPAAKPQSLRTLSPTAAILNGPAAKAIPQKTLDMFKTTIDSLHAEVQQLRGRNLELMLSTENI